LREDQEEEKKKLKENKNTNCHPIGAVGLSFSVTISNPGLEQVCHRHRTTSGESCSGVWTMQPVTAFSISFEARNWERYCRGFGNCGDVVLRSSPCWKLVATPSRTSFTRLGSTPCWEAVTVPYMRRDALLGWSCVILDNTINCSLVRRGICTRLRHQVDKGRN